MGSRPAILLPSWPSLRPRTGYPPGRPLLRQAADNARRRHAHHEVMAHCTSRLGAAGRAAGDPRTPRHELALQVPPGPGADRPPGLCRPRRGAHLYPGAGLCRCPGGCPGARPASCSGKSPGMSVRGQYQDRQRTGGTVFCRPSGGTIRWRCLQARAALAGGGLRPPGSRARTLPPAPSTAPIGTATGHDTAIIYRHFLSEALWLRGYPPRRSPSSARRAPGPRARPPCEPAAQYEQYHPAAPTLPQWAGGTPVGGSHDDAGDRAGRALLAHAGDHVSWLGIGGARPDGGEHRTVSRGLPSSGPPGGGSGCVAGWRSWPRSMGAPASSTRAARCWRRPVPWHAKMGCRPSPQNSTAFREISCCRWAADTRKETPKQAAQGAGHCPAPAGQSLRTTRRVEPGAAVAAAGQTRRMLRGAAGAVYGWFTEGFDTAGPAGGQSPAGRPGVGAT